jgi:hypothetical protein
VLINQENTGLCIGCIRNPIHAFFYAAICKLHQIYFPMKPLLFSVVLAWFVLNLGAQNMETEAAAGDTLSEWLVEEIEFADLSHLWAGSKSQDYRLGFIGPEYERLQLRLISVIKNPDNPFEYFLYGKTRVSSVICEFQGSLNITETGFYEDQANQKFKKGFLSGDFVLFEDPGCMHSGIFRGSFVSNFYTDEIWTFYYDDLAEETPAFSNNQFQGYWSSYTGGEEALSSWGDHRIPGAGDLDAGYAAFLPALKYLENGWKEYGNEVKMLKNGEKLPEWWK